MKYTDPSGWSLAVSWWDEYQASGGRTPMSVYYYNEYCYSWGYSDNLCSEPNWWGKSIASYVIDGKWYTTEEYNNLEYQAQALGYTAEYGDQAVNVMLNEKKTGESAVNYIIIPGEIVYQGNGHWNDKGSLTPDPNGNVAVYMLFAPVVLEPTISSSGDEQVQDENRPFIKSPYYPYCESKSSLKNLYYWYEHIGNRVDQIFEGDCNNGNPPKPVQKFVQMFPPTSAAINGSTMASGTKPFSGDSLNGFQRWIAPSVSILLKNDNLPFGTDIIWDICTELNTSKVNE